MQFKLQGIQIPKTQPYMYDQTRNPNQYADSAWIYITEMSRSYIITREYIIRYFMRRYGVIDACTPIFESKKDGKLGAFVKFPSMQIARQAAADSDYDRETEKYWKVYVAFCSTKPHDKLTRIYVRNLKVSQSELEDMFSPFGTVLHSFINLRQRFGFLSFSQVRYAIRAKQEMDGTGVMDSDKPMSVELANFKATNAKCRRSHWEYIRVDKLPLVDASNIVRQTCIPTVRKSPSVNMGRSVFIQPQQQQYTQSPSMSVSNSQQYSNMGSPYSAMSSPTSNWSTQYSNMSPISQSPQLSHFASHPLGVTQSVYSPPLSPLSLRTAYLDKNDGDSDDFEGWGHFNLA